MTSRSKCSFSIDHILNTAGSTCQVEPVIREEKELDWIHCTRYRPPKLNRPKKKEFIQRRNAGRNPRIPFSTDQVALLESKFQQTAYLSSSQVAQLADHLKLSPSRVKIWFQNRRARERRERDEKGHHKTKHSEEITFTEPTHILQNPQADDKCVSSSPKSSSVSSGTMHKTTTLASIDCKNNSAVNHLAWIQPTRRQEERLRPTNFYEEQQSVIELWNAYKELLPGQFRSDFSTSTLLLLPR